MLARAVAAYQADYSNDDEDETVSFLRRTLRKRLPGLILFSKKESSNEDSEVLQKSWHRSPSQTSSGCSTPPPSYHTSPRNSLYKAIEDAEDDDSDDTTSPTGLATPVAETPPSLEGPDGFTTGVRWKYARRGLSLLSIAVDGESSLDQDPRFNRKLYLDSLNHMLEGLPSDLTPDEETALIRRLPDSLSGTRTIESHLDVRVDILEPHSKTADQYRQPSILHNTVAAVTFYMIIFLNFILPYVQLGLEKAYRYDRKHKISDRMLVQGISTANAVSQYTMAAAGMVCAMNDGEVGETMKEVAVWWMRELAGGLYDGVGRGMHRFAPQRTRNMRKDTPYRGS